MFGQDVNSPFCCLVIVPHQFINVGNMVDNLVRRYTIWWNVKYTALQIKPGDQLLVKHVQNHTMTIKYWFQPPPPPSKESPPRCGSWQCFAAWRIPRGPLRRSQAFYCTAQGCIEPGKVARILLRSYLWDVIGKYTNLLPIYKNINHTSTQKWQFYTNVPNKLN